MERKDILSKAIISDSYQHDSEDLLCFDITFPGMVEEIEVPEEQTEEMEVTEPDLLTGGTKTTIITKTTTIMIKQLQPKKFTVHLGIDRADKMSIKQQKQIALNENIEDLFIEVNK